MSILELLSRATSLKLELTRAILGQSDSLHKRYLAVGKQVRGEGRRRAGIFASRRGRVAALYRSVCQCDQCSTVTVVVEMTSPTHQLATLVSACAASTPSQ